MKVISAITLDELTDVLMNLVEDDQLDFEYEVNDHVEKGYVQIH